MLNTYHLRLSEKFAENSLPRSPNEHFPQDRKRSCWAKKESLMILWVQSRSVEVVLLCFEEVLNKLLEKP